MANRFWLSAICCGALLSSAACSGEQAYGQGPPTVAAAIEALTPFGATVEQQEDGYVVRFTRNFSDEDLAQAAKQLVVIPHLVLDLSYTKVIDVTPLEGLSSLEWTCPQK